MRDGYEEVANETVTLKELFKGWNRWRLEMRTVKKISQEEFKEKCDEAFGTSNQEGVYQHLRVFLDPDDYHEFRLECDANKQKRNPTEDAFAKEKDALMKTIEYQARELAALRRSQEELRKLLLVISSTLSNTLPQ